MIDFLTIVLLVFGALQIILFFKMWGMTNDVDEIRKKLEIQPTEEDALIIQAQMHALSGSKDESFKAYQESFYKRIIELFQKTIKEYGDEDNMNYIARDEYYESKFKEIEKSYQKGINKLGMEFNAENFNTYKKVYSIISK